MVHASVKEFVELARNIFSGRDISVEDFGNSVFNQMCTLSFDSVAVVHVISVINNTIRCT